MMHAYRWGVLSRRLGIFRTLLWAIVLSSVLLYVFKIGQADWFCQARLLRTVIAGLLELVAGYFIAGVAVSFHTIRKHGPFEANLGWRLSWLGTAGAVSAILAALPLIIQRC